jgi:hypothetical protein
MPGLTGIELLNAAPGSGQLALEIAEDESFFEKRAA